MTNEPAPQNTPRQPWDSAIEMKHESWRRQTTTAHLPEAVLLSGALPLIKRPNSASLATEGTLDFSRSQKLPDRFSLQSRTVGDRQSSCRRPVD